jgi:hypothetical protein
MFANADHNDSRHCSDTQPAVSAGVLPEWTSGELPSPPVLTWRNLSSLIGPGILLAGASIASGEWLAGPGLTAQFGGTLLWIATLSIVAQVFANIEFMRYTIYCGEPLLVGAFRIWPGPKLWAFVYACLEIAQIWPYNVANAAVPLASAAIGRLPGPSDAQMVKTLGVVLFLLAFVPLIFGGTVYKTLERIMSAKMVFVLLFLGFVSFFLVSRHTALEVFRGFVSFGQMPLRADSIIDGRHFMVTRCEGSTCLAVRGTVEPAGTVVTEWKVNGRSLASNDPLLSRHAADFDEVVKFSEQQVRARRYYVADVEPTGSFQQSGRWSWLGAGIDPAVFARSRSAARVRLGADSRVCIHRRSRRTDECVVFKLCARQGIWYGRSSGGNPQRYWWHDDQAVARRQGVSFDNRKSATLERLDETRRARAGGTVDGLLLHRHGTAVHDVD